MPGRVFRPAVGSFARPTSSPAIPRPLSLRGTLKEMGRIPRLPRDWHEHEQSPHNTRVHFSPSPSPTPPLCAIPPLSGAAGCSVTFFLTLPSLSCTACPPQWHGWRMKGEGGACSPGELHLSLAVLFPCPPPLSHHPAPPDETVTRGERWEKRRQWPCW